MAGKPRKPVAPRPDVSFIFAALRLSEGVQATLSHLVRQIDRHLDGNAEVILVCVEDAREFARAFPRHVKAVADKGGIAAAWNIGLARAKGRLIAFHGDGDYLGEEAARALARHLQQGVDAQILNFAAHFYRAGALTRRMAPAAKISVGAMGTNVQTPCLFIPAALLQGFRFDERLAIAMDIDLVLMLQERNAPLLPVAAAMLIEEDGISVIARQRAMAEYAAVLNKHGVAGGTLLQWAMPLYGPYRSIKTRLRPVIRHMLRQAKHLAVLALNILLNATPGGVLRHLAFGLFGIRLGYGSSVRSFFRLYRAGNLTIGENAVVNRGCTLDNRAPITIGNNVSIAHEVKIYTAGHHLQSPFFEQFCRPVTIGDHVAVFPGSIINPGAELGRGCVVLGGSSVYGRFPENTIIAGNPAKAVGQRSGNYRYSCSYDFRFAP